MGEEDTERAKAVIHCSFSPIEKGKEALVCMTVYVWGMGVAAYIAMGFAVIHKYEGSMLSRIPQLSQSP